MFLYMSLNGYIDIYIYIHTCITYIVKFSSWYDKYTIYSHIVCDANHECQNT